MHKKLAIGIAVITSSIALMSISSSEVFAQSDPQRNNFGQGASNLGQTGQMGDHSKDGGAAGTHPYTTNPVTGSSDKAGRLGIGTIGHPADVADTLCPPGSSNPLCP